METFSALLALCAGNSQVTGEFPTQRPVTRSLDCFFDLHLNKPLSKQSWGWLFETPSRSSWRHWNVHTVPLCFVVVWGSVKVNTVCRVTSRTLRKQSICPTAITQPWWIGVNTNIVNLSWTDYITTTKQITKTRALFKGSIVSVQNKTKGTLWWYCKL